VREAEEQIATLIERLQSVSGKKRPITEATDVLYDLKLRGEPLEEILMWMEGSQAVDFSDLDYRTLPLDDPPQHLFTFWGQREFEPLPVRHLISVLKSGKWTRS
jgi:hypothetical protein